MRLATLLAAVLIGAGTASPLYAASKPAPREKECVIQGERIDCSCVGKSDKPNDPSGQGRCRDDRAEQGASLLQTPGRPAARWALPRDGRRSADLSTGEAPNHV
jgi:hypothetical protein